MHVHRAHNSMQVSVGQTPSIMELQRVLYQQLTSEPMPVKDGATAATQLEELQAACMGQRWLIALDDVSSSERSYATYLSLVCSHTLLLIHHRFGKRNTRRC